ncbi:transcriptional repressor TCF25-domain-containing protein [Xylaria palmicola]|nr:transcriptional repressor TCF25-domain-containing protein [Xylaria palmicola]
MSSRQLRKLQKQRELEQLQASGLANDDSDEGENDAPVRVARTSTFSAFAALGGDDDGDDEEDEGHDGHDDEHHDSDDKAQPSGPSSSASKKRNKNKKKKKKGKKPGDYLVSPSSTDPIQTGGDDIDEALRELSLSKNKSSAPTSSPAESPQSIAYERVCELLRINTYHLKAVNEIRNLFGRDTIAAAENEENEERGRTPREPNMLNPVDIEAYLKGQLGKTLPEVTLRRNPFVLGKETWPRAPTEGLSMTQVNEKAVADNSLPGTVEFSFVHSPDYNTLEQEFFRLAQNFEPMALINFLRRHPYHISSLIQVSLLARHDANLVLSADLCERALFTFGRVGLSGFRQKLEEGKARLDFRRPENRQFWLAGYYYLKNLTKKGTHKTALEWAKLLFSLDPSDPYGMIHLIHPMAIRARESKWFIDFCDSEALDGFDTMQDYIRQTLVLARLQQEDRAGAKVLLLEGMERLPWLYSGLYKALNLDVPKSIWGMQPRNEDEDLFVELYIYQTKRFWDNQQSKDLLKEAAREAKKPDSQTFGFPPVVGRNVARLVFLEDLRSVLGRVSRGFLDTPPNWQFDPLPPPKEENIFSYDSQQEPWEPRPRRGLEEPTPYERQLVDQVRRDGVPPEFQPFIEEVIAQSAEAGEPAPSPLQIIMNLFRARGLVDDDDDDDDEELSEVENRMPGAWVEGLDDELMEMLTGGSDVAGETADDAPAREAGA